MGAQSHHHRHATTRGRWWDTIPQAALLPPSGRASGRHLHPILTTEPFAKNGNGRSHTGDRSLAIGSWHPAARRRHYARRRPRDDRVADQAVRKRRRPDQGCAHARRLTVADRHAGPDSPRSDRLARISMVSWSLFAGACTTTVSTRLRSAATRSGT